MTNRPESTAILSLVLAFLAGCAGDATGPTTPTAPEAPKAVASVAVAPGRLSLKIGGSALLSARPLDEDGAVLTGYTIAWTSSDTAVATVSAAGRVSAHRVGTAAIRASSDGKTGQVTVSVLPADTTRPPVPTEPTVAWIQITPAGSVLPQALGTSRQLGVVARASNGQEITGRPIAWSSSNSSVASVSASGMLAAVAVGTAWITAEVDGRRDSTLVSVPSLIARIETDPATLTLGVGDTARIIATARDAHGASLVRTFAWSSSNSAVATIDAAGRVVATGAGTALVTVTSESRSATTLITVTGELYRLTDASGGPLPAILDTVTIAVNGVARVAHFQVTGGTVRLRDGRYELRIHGWLISDGSAPAPATIGSEGVMAYDVWTGDPLFMEGAEWVNQEPRFRGRMRGERGLELDWNRTPGAAAVPLGFTR